jgi:branched-chain amino acid transport system ATP-binding protein
VTAVTPPVLETRGLRKHFGGIRVLEDINLQFETGKLSAIIGPNGAGKTTCFNLLTGFLMPDAGRIYYHQRDITRMKPEKRTRIGISRSFQILNLFDSFTVLENVRIAVPAMRQRGLDLWRPAGSVAEAQHKAAAIVKLIGLGGRENVDAKYLSYGQRRLLEIGVSLASEPKVLLMDEPTSGLGSRPKEVLSDLVRRLAPTLSIVIIEHNMEFVMALADSVTVLHRGYVVASGPPQSICESEVVRNAYLGNYRAKVDDVTARP